MENHPIPQDITGFQFKLIGKMTVRQFIYLATGVIVAWVFYILPLPFLIRAPFILLFAGLGAAFAFVPIGGRPMDTMVANFIKALFAPSTYVYQKQGGQLFGQSRQTKQSEVKQTQQTPPQVINLPGPIPQPSTKGPLATNFTIEPQLSQIPTTPPPLPRKEEAELILEDEKKLEEQSKELEKELSEIKKEEAGKPVPEVHKKAEELERLLAETQAQRDALEKELLTLKAKLESKGEEKFTPSQAQPPRQTPNVKTVPQDLQKAAGIVPQVDGEPNLIRGIIKDPRGNPLQNILVEVKDAEDNPVRAFKTNGLGEFASATSLSNGKYSVSFEDPKGENKFDAVTIEATGTPLMPLEIISVDPREELRRELFN